ncbi:MAG: DEAD/DEAH box helicase [Myxococcales bacterium]|nr:DEAD/DEAH box helicase [Myxococcales bacterium]
MHAVLERFSSPVRTWFGDAFATPTEVQIRGWPSIAEGQNTLLLAPTGSGKTLAAFLAGLDQLVSLGVDEPPGVRVLYVSPLKALVYDIERNLRAPLVGIANAASRQGESLRPIRVDVRTGDTSQRDRRRQAKDPADILVTTPESLYLILGSQAHETLKSVQTVIVDEIHVMAGSKRGVHLALSLERLARLCDTDPQRVGLSATQRPLSEIARFLGGDRSVEIVDASAPPHVDLQIVVPVVDMEHPVVPGGAPTGGGEGQRQRVGGAQAEGPSTPPPSGAPDRLSAGLWPVVYPRLLELIRAHRSTIVFTNSRLLCERLAQRLNELAGEELVHAHHGSISHARRHEVEEALKAGRVPGIVATSSLELGIDMGAVDLVILVESPGSVASGLQRVGRAGHSVGERSIGRIFPKYRGDLVESVVVSQAMLEGAVEPTSVPQNCLDVLAQQIVAMCGAEDWTVADLHAVVRRAYPFHGLTEGLLTSVLDMLSGRYPSDDFAELRPRITWDRTSDELKARRGSRMLSLLNGGTIPDRGLYGVFLVGDGPRLGELDEEMVYESRKGDLIILGASTWRIEEITRDRVLVSPAPGEPGRLPFWHGERPGRPVDLGRRLGAFLREVSSRGEDARQWLVETTPLDDLAAGNVLRYVLEQQAVTGQVPTDRSLVVECFRDELGDWRICVLSPFGSRVHAPWALALEARLAVNGGYDVQALWTDDGIALRFADVDELPPLTELWPDPEEVEDLVVEQLGRSALFAARFRENAARSLLLPRRNPKGRQPLWAQRLKSQNLLQVASAFPAFPVVLETYRECLQDVLDLPALVELLTAVRSREIAVHEVQTKRPSPFARSLVFAYVAAFMYAGDAPIAERRAAALSLDRALLRELLGQEELRDLLDPTAVAVVEAELQRLVPERAVRHADALHDMLRTLGDLTDEEVVARCAEDPTSWLKELELERRVVPVRIGGEARWIAVEDAGRMRDALGVALPPGLPAIFLETVDTPLESLALRWARTHGPFHAVVLAQRWGLPIGVVEAVLRALEAQDRLVSGEIRPGGTGWEWCHPDVLARLKRRSLAVLRNEIAPVEGEVFARFLTQWHGVGSERTGLGRLREVLLQLEGVALPASVWLRGPVLRARVADFQPDWLDQLGAMGEIVWIGAGPLGPKDGRIVLVRRDRVDLLFDPPEPPEGLLDDPDEPLSAVRKALYDHLLQRGASFMVGLQRAVPEAKMAQLTRALWDLAWAGLVTNDTFGPLKGLQARTRKASRRGRSQITAGGRWSAVVDLFSAEPVKGTERAHARAAMLLERYGVACAAAAKADGIPGAFSAVYPVLRAMEEAGRARRGWFVDGLVGAQFAVPGAVDRLRACRDQEPEVLVLDAVDPANPWGTLLSWPESEGRVRRVAGATVVLVGGAPALFVERGERHWITFPSADEPRLLKRAIEGWVGQQPDRWRTVRIDRIDGKPAPQSPHADTFLAAGFAHGATCLQRVRS